MKYTKILPGFLLLITIAVACKKVATPQPIGDAGQTIVKLMDGLADTASGYSSGYRTANVELVSTPQTFEVVDVRRDVPNNAELNKTMTVIIKNDPGIVTAYDPTLTPFPVDAFTVDPSTPLVGTDYKVTINPGEFAKSINLTINNILAQDLSRSYALGFTISSVDANGHIAGLEKSVVVKLNVRNQWDGDYTSEGGYFYHPTSPRGLATGAHKTCTTSGSNSVYTELGDFDGVQQGATVYYVTLTIDATNNVTESPGPGPAPATNPIVKLPTLPSTNPGYTAFPGSTPTIYNNTWDPVAKKFYLRYGYIGTTGYRVVEEVLKKN